MRLLKPCPPLRAVFLLPLLAVWLAAAGNLHAQDTGPCAEQGETWGFEDDRRNAGFAFVQLQRGKAAPVDDPVQPGNVVARLTAGAKTRGKVGKADFVHRFPPLKAGTVVAMQARMYFPSGSPLNSLILMDLECASCGVDTNPGIRLYLRRSMLRVDRSKIGIEQPFLPTAPRLVQTGVWHRISWLVTLGAGAAGRSVVSLDGEVVSDARGTTLLTQEVVPRHMNLTVREQADRFQVGLTANSNPEAAEMLLDDVRFCQIQSQT